MNLMEISFDEKKREKLVDLLKNRPSSMNEKLAEMKRCRERIQDPQFVWTFLLQSAATLGGNRGAEYLFANPDHLKALAFDKLAEFEDAAKLEDHLLSVFNKCKFRYAERKAEQMTKNVALIKKMGGITAVCQSALKLKGKRAKIKFIQQFQGVGDKYGRNFWMDVYDPDFYDAIALDDRMSKVSEALKIDEDEPYALREKFYLKIAKEAGVQGWELDRLLFNFNDYFLKELSIA